jgi:hypothetical protein
MEEDKNIPPKQPVEIIPEVEQSESPISSGETISTDKIITTEQPQTEDMEVHHHAHDPAAPHHKKNWKSYFWEFLMLFLAITLGFLVENQREHYIEHLRAKEFAKSLIKDLESDKLSSDFHQLKSERYIVFVDSLLQVSNRKLEGKNAAAFSFYTRFLYWTEAFSWNRATFEQIKNSGSLRYFKNYSLLEKLMKYEAMVNQTEGEFSNHQTRGNTLLNSINEIIDPSYHQLLSKYRIASIDSLSPALIENYFSIKTESLEPKRDKIMVLLNMAIVQQRNLRFNIDSRLKPTKLLADELINELKNEYHLK